MAASSQTGGPASPNSTSATFDAKPSSSASYFAKPPVFSGDVSGSSAISHHHHHNFVTPSPTSSYHNVEGGMPCDHEKRARECSFSSSEISEAQSQQATPKKKRSNAYIAPRQVPSTFTSQMGSLVVSKDSNSQQRVGFRRQLSSSKIEAFLGDHDAMDVEPESTRPRSMSF